MADNTKDLIVQRLLRQSTWSVLSAQFLALAVSYPALAPHFGAAAALCSIVKLFVPEVVQDGGDK